MVKATKFIIGIICLQIIYLYARCSSYYAPVATNDIYFHDPESEAMFKLLELRLARENLFLDHTKISDICSVDSLSGMSVDRSVLGRSFYGSIIIRKDLLEDDNILLGYWVMAHEVLHNQGWVEHDTLGGTLMAPTVDAFYWAILMDLDINDIVIGHFHTLLDKNNE